jgi:aminoglycoside/choline kinase family phosphotransferase
VVDLTLDTRFNQLQDWLKKQFNDTSISLSVVSGDASFRRYFRFVYQDVSYIGVDAPAEKEDSRPFVEISSAYAKLGLSVPKVIHFDYQLGFMCLSDLGDELLLPALNESTVAHFYQKALALIPIMGLATTTQSGIIPIFDESLLRNEMQLLNDWFLPHHLAISLDDDDSKIVDEAFDLLVKNALEQPIIGVHRDYHSRNLMLQADGELAVIDYQDAVLGPITYDAVSLLRDCYITWPDEVVYGHLLEFKQVMRLSCPQLDEVSDEQFIRWFDLMGLQRHIKVCGVFSRLYYRDGKAGYLDDIPTVMDYVIEVGSKYPEFSMFVELLKNKLKPLLLKKTQLSKVN